MKTTKEYFMSNPLEKNYLIEFYASPIKFRTSTVTVKADFPDQAIAVLADSYPRLRVVRIKEIK